MIQKIFTTSFAVIFFLFATFLYTDRQSIAQEGIVAGDYDKDYGDYDKDYSDYSHYGSSSGGEEIVAKEPQIVTRQVRLSDTVEQSITTTTRFDSDGDGIFDEEDEFPTINNYLIVKDENRNGIVDEYEQK